MALKLVALRMRNVIESFSEERRPNGLMRFPIGACGDATLLLGTFLIDKGEDPFNYMMGRRRENKTADFSHHAWLQRGDLIIDVTADQFCEINEKIIVTDPSGS